MFCRSPILFSPRHAASLSSFQIKYSVFYRSSQIHSDFFDSMTSDCFPRSDQYMEQKLISWPLVVGEDQPFERNVPLLFRTMITKDFPIAEIIPYSDPNLLYRIEVLGSQSSFSRQVDKELSAIAEQSTQIKIFWKYPTLDQLVVWKVLDGEGVKRDGWLHHKAFYNAIHIREIRREMPTFKTQEICRKILKECR